MSSLKFFKFSCLFLGLICSLDLFLAVPTTTADDLIVAQEVAPIPPKAKFVTISEKMTCDEQELLYNADEEDMIFLTPPQFPYPLKKNKRQNKDKDGFGSVKRSGDSDEEEVSETVSDELVNTEYQLFNSETNPSEVTQIDFSDFMALIPYDKVREFISNYYWTDKKIKKVYAYLSSEDFVILKERTLRSREVRMFVRYLELNGINFWAFIDVLTNMTTQSFLDEYLLPEVEVTTVAIVVNNDTTTRKYNEDLNMDDGFNGFVDGILEVLPQEEILEKFFDKLETDPKFTRLVDSIRAPIFERLLNYLRGSMVVRVFAIELLTNGIDIRRVLSALKSYFFLGGF